MRPAPAAKAADETASRSASGVNTTILNDLGAFDALTGFVASGRKRRDINQAEPPAEDVVDPFVRVVKRGVRAGDRDARAGQLPEIAGLREVGADLLDLAEEHRMVADDQPGVFSNGFGGRSRGDRQTGHDAFHRAGGVAPQ